MAGKEIYKPKSVVIDKIELTNFDESKKIDISGMFVNLSVYEDIYQSQIVGDITIEDSLELIEFFPIIGEEMIHIKWHVPCVGVKDYMNLGKMRVYKLGNRSASGVKGGKSSTYTLFFTSIEALKNLNTTVSRSFNTKSASDIVKTIYEDYIKINKDFDVESTEGKLKLIIPNWKPFRAINWVAGNRALTKSLHGDYFFFESTNKNKGPRFNFKSLTTLSKGDPVFTIEFKVQNMSDPRGGSVDVHSPYNVENFEMPKHGDILDNTVNGQYAQTWIYHDPLRKKFVVSKINHSDDVFEVEKGKNLFYSPNIANEAQSLQFIRMPGGVNAFPSSISPSKGLNNDASKGAELSTLRSSIPYISSRESSDELNTTSAIHDVAHKRAFKIQQLNNYKTAFSDIPGNHLIQLGSVVYFNKPHLTNDTDFYNKKSGRFNDRFISGNYLVTRMSHNIYINPDKSELEYTISIECNKDTFNEKPSYKEIK